MSDRKLRLGHVEGDVAARLRETLAVQGVSIEDFTKQVVKEHLSRKFALDMTGHDVGQMSDTDRIIITDNPVIRIRPPTRLPVRHVEGLGICLDCSDGPVPLTELANVAAKATTRELRRRISGR